MPRPRGRRPGGRRLGALARAKLAGQLRTGRAGPDGRAVCTLTYVKQNTWISLHGSGPPPSPGSTVTPRPAGLIDSVTLRFGPHPAPGLASSSQDGQQRRGGRAAVLACPAPVTAKPSLWVKCPL